MYKDLTYFDEHVTDVSAIKNSITNILLTARGSLPGKPRFGSDLYKILFSQMDYLTESMAKNYIFEALTEYEDRIIINDVNITEVPEYNKYIINITFSYKNLEYLTDTASENIEISINV